MSELGKGTDAPPPSAPPEDGPKNSGPQASAELVSALREIPSSIRDIKSGDLTPHFAEAANPSGDKIDPTNDFNKAAGTSGDGNPALEPEGPKFKSLGI
jgi:hypothetical protein